MAKFVKKKINSYFAVISFDFICLSIQPKVMLSTSECPATGNFFLHSQIISTWAICRSCPPSFCHPQPVHRSGIVWMFWCGSVRQQRLSVFSTYHLLSKWLLCKWNLLHIFGGKGLDSRKVLGLSSIHPRLCTLPCIFPQPYPTCKGWC